MEGSTSVSVRDRKKRPPSPGGGSCRQRLECNDSPSIGNRPPGSGEVWIMKRIRGEGSIIKKRESRFLWIAYYDGSGRQIQENSKTTRSEERRVGKECRERWWADV